jgi:cellulose biosynthesis protein BcsQ
VIKSAERMLRRPIPAKVVLMSVQPTTNVAEHIEREVVKAGLPLMATRISRLVAFQEMSFTGIAPVQGAAGLQATAFLNEIAAMGMIPETEKAA